ncbi:MAG TPA: hypothetical protein VNA68_02405 [Candidatus Dormibacteraeota bacterium]|nr:hypothetical protein [Candidatus Dormibacteraeota bacterium]
MKKTKNKIALIITIALATLAIGTAFYIKSTQDKANQGKTEQQILQEEEAKANLDPKKDNEAYYRQQNGATEQQTGRANVNITSLGQDASMVYAAAMVDGQTSGTCTLVMTKAGSPRATGQAPLKLITSYYACQVEISKSSLAKGEWEAKIEFSSDKAKGVSDTQKITVN